MITVFQHFSKTMLQFQIRIFFENLIYSGSMYYDFQKVSAIKALHKDNIFYDTIE